MVTDIGTGTFLITRRTKHAMIAISIANGQGGNTGLALCDISTAIADGIAPFYRAQLCNMSCQRDHWTHDAGVVDIGLSAIQSDARAHKIKRIVWPQEICQLNWQAKRGSKASLSCAQGIGQAVFDCQDVLARRRKPDGSSQDRF